MYYFMPIYLKSLPKPPKVEDISDQGVKTVKQFFFQEHFYFGIFLTFKI